MIRFSVWFVSGYAHVFILLSVVVVTLPTLLRSSDEVIPIRRTTNRCNFTPSVLHL